MRVRGSRTSDQKITLQSKTVSPAYRIAIIQARTALGKTNQRPGIRNAPGCSASIAKNKQKHKIMIESKALAPSSKDLLSLIWLQNYPLYSIITQRNGVVNQKNDLSEVNTLDENRRGSLQSQDQQLERKDLQYFFVRLERIRLERMTLMARNFFGSFSY